MKNPIQLSITALTALGSVLLGNMQPASALNWIWNYSATGIQASGFLTTTDTPNDMDFFTITDIMGTRNDEIITGLFSTGAAIPGNEPFVVDNLISLKPAQFTSSGLGFSTSGGNFVNVFFADFLTPPGFFEVYSAPPFIPGFENFGPEDSESSISFSASIVSSVPEPSMIFSILVVLGVGGAIQKTTSQTSHR